MKSFSFQETRGVKQLSNFKNMISLMPILIIKILRIHLGTASMASKNRTTCLFTSEYTQMNVRTNAKPAEKPSSDRPIFKYTGNLPQVKGL